MYYCGRLRKIDTEIIILISVFILLTILYIKGTVRIVDIIMIYAIILSNIVVSDTNKNILILGTSLNWIRLIKWILGYVKMAFESVKVWHIDKVLLFMVLIIMVLILFIIILILSWVILDFTRSSNTFMHAYSIFTITIGLIISMYNERWYVALLYIASAVCVFYSIKYIERIKKLGISVESI